jgi:hypothetical protein
MRELGASLAFRHGDLNKQWIVDQPPRLVLDKLETMVR